MGEEIVKPEAQNGLKPTFTTSTFSLMTLIVVVGFTGLCIWTKDMSSLKDVTLMLLSGYGVKKGMELASK